MKGKPLDEVDRRIIQHLTADSRISLKQLAQRVGLSPPSTSERLRRLEDRAVITAFTIELSPQALGYALQAIVRIRPLPGQAAVVQALLAAIPEICECDKVTGEDCFIVRVHVKTITQLDEILERIADKAETNSAIVKSQPIPRRAPPLP